MSKNQPIRVSVLRLSKMAAMAVVFLGMGTTARIDAAPLTASAIALPKAITQAKPTANLPAQENVGLHILSPKDAALYTAAFAAQEKDDTKTADDALAQIKDRRLVGHVLADRYLRHAPSLTEIQVWSAANADLPEAQPIYDEARHMKGFATMHIARPAVPIVWAGNGNETGATFGFRNQREDSGLRKTAAIRINAALHHGDPLKAREILTTELQRGTLTIGNSGDVISHIAAAFYYEGETERARSMSHLAAASGIPLGLWIDGLAAWKQHDWISSTRSFASLAQAPGLSPWDRSAAAFWAYRAAKHMGDENQAKHWLAESAKYPRSFYGFMAASLTGHSPVRSWKMPDLTQHNIDVLAQTQPGWQALALTQIGKTSLAESELHRLNPAGNRDLQTAALALAEKAHMTSATLQLAGVATNENGQPYEGALYPVPPWQPTDGFKVDRALIYALMRRESQFNPTAVSSRGACGLMQIMPSTARTLTDDNTNTCSGRLRDPATNMEMGQKYVRVLAGQPAIGNNLLLLLAAYNGGPGNVLHWLDADNRTDPLLFVESLPLRETHDYVQQVLMQYWMYRSRMSEPDGVAQLARGEWPHYALNDGHKDEQALASMQQIAVK